MDDLISCQAAIEAIRPLQTYKLFEGDDMLLVDKAEVQTELMILPSAEPEQKIGRWMRHYSRPNVYADLYWHCSECGYKNDDRYADKYHNFCPNRGAKMGGEHE